MPESRMGSGEWRIGGAETLHGTVEWAVWGGRNHNNVLNGVKIEAKNH